MKTCLITSAAILLFTGCITTKKFSSFVEGKKPGEIRAGYQDKVSVFAENAEPAENRYLQRKKTLIPAILYWDWNSTIECDLGVNTRLEYLKRGIYKAADSLGLKDALGERKLEIRVKDMPGRFIYVNRGTAVILIVAYTVIGEETITPEPFTLEYKYVIKTPGEPDFHGYGLLPSEEKPVKNIWKSSRKFTRHYLDEYQREMDKMGMKIAKDAAGKLSAMRNGR